MSPEVLYLILTSGGVFVLVLCIWGMGVILWSSKKAQRARQIGSRLGLPREGVENGRTLRLWLDGKEVETAVGWSAPGSIASTFSTMCRESGWDSPPYTIGLLLLGLMCAVFVVTISLTSNFMLAFVFPLNIIIFFWLYSGFRISSRRTLFDTQLIDALDLAARSLRVGHPLVGALRLASEEISAPVGPMFAEIVQRQELGSSMEDSIRQTAQESNSDDMKLFATAVIIQLRSGGNLADMMERVAAVMRDRLRLGRRVRVLITQAQFSKYILLILPVVMFVLLNWLNPEYMRPLYFDRSGQMILLVSAALLVLGVLIMNRLATIRY